MYWMNKHIEGNQIIPVWHLDNVELKPFENQQMQEDAFSALSSLPKSKALQKNSVYYESHFKGGFSWQGV